jgi:hypothetical protein
MRKRKERVQVSVRVELPFTPTAAQSAELQEMFTELLAQMGNEARSRHLVELPNRPTADS